jgi:EmrB/QacA subfamily drug resistance transporter
MADGALTPRQIRVVFAGVIAGLALSALDSNILNTALPTIVNEFEGGKQFAWVGTMYLLTSTAVTPLFGKLSDQFGRRMLFQTAIVVFVVGSVLCAMTQNMTQLIAARGIQGVGGGGLFAMSFAIIGDVVPPRDRGRYVGFITTVFTVSSIVGPLFGGIVVDHTSWRWIFLINVPVGIVALVITSSALRLPFVKAPHAIDYLGAGLLVGAVCALVLAMAWAGETYGWTSSTTLGFLLSAALLTVAFVLWERRAAEPIVPLRLFDVRTMRHIVPMMFLAGAVMFGATAFVPLFLQAVTGVRPTLAGLLMSPFAIGIAVGAIVTGRRTSITGRYKAWPILGLSLAAGGMLVLSLLQPDTTYVPVAMVGLALAGVGIGALVPVGTMAAQNAVEMKDLGTASSTVLFFRQLGGVIGLALFGAVLNAQVAGKIDSELVRRPLSIRALPDAQRDAALDVLTNGLTTVFLVAVPILLLALPFALRLPELPLRTTSALYDAHASRAAAEVGIEPTALA